MVEKPETREAHPDAVFVTRRNHLIIVAGPSWLQHIGDSCSRCPIDVARWRDSIAAGKLLGPRIRLAATILESARLATDCTRSLS